LTKAFPAAPKRLGVAIQAPYRQAQHKCVGAVMKAGLRG
jgi:hypothetical protein